MKALGESAATIAANTQAGFRAAATVPSATPAQAMRTINELRSILGNSKEARVAAEAALEFAAVLRSQNPNMSERAADAAMVSWLKGIDIQGAFVNRKTGQLDPKKAAEAFQMMEVASLLTNGLLTGQGFYQFTRMTGPAASLTQLKAYLEQTVEVMLGLGRTGGRGMQMAFTKLLGGNLTKAQAEELVALGAAKQSDIKKEFGHYTLRPGALVGYTDLATKGVNYWFQHDLLPLLQKAEHGKGMAGLVAALKKSGGMDEKTAALVSLITNIGAMPVTAERLFAFLLMNQAQVNRFKTQFDTARKTNTAATLESTSWTMNVQNFEAAWQGLMQPVGGPAAQLAIPIMQDLAWSMKTLTGMVGAHPGATVVLVDAIGTIGAVLTVSGGLKAGVSALRALTGVLPLLRDALGGFAAGAEGAGGLALLTTGLPELSIAIIGVAAAMPMLQSALDSTLDWLGRQVGIQFPSDQKVAALNTRAKKATVQDIEHFAHWITRPTGWFSWLNLRVPGTPPLLHFQPAPMGTDTTWPAAPRLNARSPAPPVTVNAPLNVTIDGSLLGADYATLDFYMQGWIRQHAQQIGAAVQQHQQHQRRRTMLDLSAIPP
ncbi:MAG: hypothetical protein ACREFJ_10880 [Acetobacteraceae bacterium]